MNINEIFDLCMEEIESYSDEKIKDLNKKYYEMKEDSCFEVPEGLDLLLPQYDELVTSAVITVDNERTEKRKLNYFFQSLNTYDDTTNKRILAA